MRRIILVAAAGALLAGCSSGDEEAPQRDTRDTRAARAGGQPCELYLRGLGVFVRVAGEEAQETCRRWEGTPGTRGPLVADRRHRLGGPLRAGMRGLPGPDVGGAVRHPHHRHERPRQGGLRRPDLTRLGRARAAPPHRRRPSRSPATWRRCAARRGRCTQGGKPVARPDEGRLCDGGAWTYAGLTPDQEAGSWRCLPDADPRDPVVCDRLLDSCRQDGERVYPPRAGAPLRPGWARVAARGGAADEGPLPLRAPGRPQGLRGRPRSSPLHRCAMAILQPALGESSNRQDASLWSWLSGFESLLPSLSRRP